MAQVSKELLARLPRTFVPGLNEQMRSWDSLFPAERREISAQLDWLTRLPDGRFHELFDPLKRLEARMELPAWDLNAERLTIADTALLTRSPHYPEWRAEVTKIFHEINSGIEAEHKTASPNRLVVCVLPAGLKLPPEPLWPRLEKVDRWVSLDKPFGAMLESFADAVAARPPAAGSEPIERTWALEYDARVARMESPACVLSYQALAPMRREFLVRLNVIQKDLRSADAAFEDLRRADFRKFATGSLAKDPRILEFVRNLLLSGNGSIMFGNAFVQWGASEVIRRVQPQALVCYFGIRPKLKPFSSIVLFEDQNRANPVADEPDPEGSLIDIRLLAEYVYLSAAQHTAYAGRTVYLFAVPELDKLLVLAPSAFVIPSTAHLTAADLSQAAVHWLA